MLGGPTTGGEEKKIIPQKKTPSPLPRHKRLRARVGANFPICRSAERMLPRSQVHAVCVREVLGHHRPMKGYEVSEVGKGGQQRCQVAVANENLRMPGNRFQIKRLRSARRQQVVRSIS